MISPEILKLIHELELKTRRLLSGQLTGDYRTLSKGSGFEFDQLRDYQLSDDVRFIDWKSSARSDKMLVRQYVQDLTRNVMLLVDGSASTLWGSSAKPKNMLMQEIAGIMAFSALYSKDAIGLMLFTDAIECVMPLASSRIQVLSLIDKLFSHRALGKGTNIVNACNHLMNMRLKKALVCIISDFLTPLDSNKLQLLAQKHELIVIRCLDPHELSMPDVSWLLVEDSEDGSLHMVNTNKRSKQGMQDTFTCWHEQQLSFFKKANIPCLTVVTGMPYISKLRNFLSHRA